MPFNIFLLKEKPGKVAAIQWESSCNTVWKTSLIPKNIPNDRFLGLLEEAEKNGHSSGAEVLALSVLVLAPGTGLCELPERHKIQRAQRNTSKIFIIVQHLSARQTPSRLVSAALLETRGVRGVPITTSYWRAAPRTGRTAATQVLVFFSPLCQI